MNLCFIDINAQIDTLNNSDNSQFIIENGHVYTYQYQEYEYEELIPFFKKRKLLESYNMPYEIDRIAKKYLYVALASTGSAIIFYQFAKAQATNSRAENKFNAVSSVSLITSIFSFGMKLIESSRIKESRKKAIQLYNEQYILKNGYQKSVSNLHISFTNDGLGLVYCF
jgi:hypothetical protein